MGTELLDIQPKELTFTFELKKQSSCSIQLFNNSNQYVAYKVKTTSPQKYCVRPNTGVLEPNGACDFTVTMRAQRASPPDMYCNDKFLIQSTVVPSGTREEDVTSNMFAKGNGKYIEEKKLKVVLLSPPESPVLTPNNGVLKQDPSNETSLKKEKVLNGVENLPPSHSVALNVEGLKSTNDQKEFRQTKDAESNSTEDLEELKLAKNLMELKFARDIEELKSQINTLELNLREADLTITKITEERGTAIQEKETLHQELAELRREIGVRRVQGGFPFLFVLMVALISVVVGYLWHP